MKLNEYRQQINEIDEKLMALFKERMQVSKYIGEYKKAHDLPILDLNREKALIESYRKIFNDEVLWSYYETLLKTIMDLSKAYQNV